MKTRREFLKATLQCLGLVSAVAFAPSYALAKISPPEVMHLGPNSMILNSNLKNCEITMDHHATIMHCHFTNAPQKSQVIKVTR